MSSPIHRHNLAKFAFRQQQECELMRAKIYDRLRQRLFGQHNISRSPIELEEAARSLKDHYAISLLEFARQLLICNAALIEAQLRVRK